MTKGIFGLLLGFFSNIFLQIKFKPFICGLFSDTVRLYDYLAKMQVCYSRYTAPGTSILWLPTSVSNLLLDGILIISV